MGVELWVEEDRMIGYWDGVEGWTSNATPHHWRTHRVRPRPGVLESRCSPKISSDDVNEEDERSDSWPPGSPSCNNYAEDYCELDLWADDEAKDDEREA